MELFRDSSQAAPGDRLFTGTGVKLIKGERSFDWELDRLTWF